jgi:D-sedoheptulose 7-phosphate isomerase
VRTAHPASDRLAVFDDGFARHGALVEDTRAVVRDAFERLAAVSARSLQAGGKILLFGNGGSAADAQHLATEFTVRYARDRAPIAALALTTDTSTLTAVGNDLGFAEVFARQIAALARPGDVCIGISTSGRSENVVRGLSAARSRGCTAAAFGGGGGGRLVGLADPLLLVPSDETARIQEMHILIGHLLCAALEAELTPP